MLVNFRYKNFRSFCNDMIFSMERTGKREQSEKIINCKCKNGSFEILPTKVIYGINASGKSSIILGLEALQEIVKSGGVKPLDEKDFFLINLPIYHFIHNKKDFFAPMELEITFTNGGNLFNYLVEITNRETETKYESIVTGEILKVNNLTVFKREKNSVVFNPENTKEFEKIYNYSKSYLKKTEEMLKDNMSEYNIFTKWFNLDRGILDSFTSWMIDELDILNSLDEIIISPNIANYSESPNILNDVIKKIVKEADFGPQKIKFCTEKGDSGNDKLIIKSEYRIKNSDNDEKEEGIVGVSEALESLGTMKLLKLVLPFLVHILNGGTLVVDELDSSIHPEIIGAIIRCFSNPEVNTNGAQLIFTTHNPAFLNEHLFRRDEIVFVEKNSDNFKSEIFTLDEFARSDAKYLKNYLEEKYINFTNIDFSKIILEMRDKIDGSKKN